MGLHLKRPEVINRLRARADAAPMWHKPGFRRSVGDRLSRRLSGGIDNLGRIWLGGAADVLALSSHGPRGRVVKAQRGVDGLGAGTRVHIDDVYLVLIEPLE